MNNTRAHKYTHITSNKDSLEPFIVKIYSFVLDYFLISRTVEKKPISAVVIAF